MITPLRCVGPLYKHCYYYYCYYYYSTLFNPSAIIGPFILLLCDLISAKAKASTVHGHRPRCREIEIFFKHLNRNLHLDKFSFQRCIIFLCFFNRSQINGVCVWGGGGEGGAPLLLVFYKSMLFILFRIGFVPP